jgi:hypothetical protein
MTALPVKYGSVQLRLALTIPSANVLPFFALSDILAVNLQASSNLTVRLSMSRSVTSQSVANTAGL